VQRIESILGGFLGGFELKHGLKGHGSRVGVQVLPAVPKSYHLAQPCATLPIPLSQSRLVDAFRPSSLVAALLR
jgi:hypothetical protein